MYLHSTYMYLQTSILWKGSHHYLTKDRTSRKTVCLSSDKSDSLPWPQLLGWEFLANYEVH